jgi:hypothetical protein
MACHEEVDHVLRSGVFSRLSVLGPCLCVWQRGMISVGSAGRLVVAKGEPKGDEKDDSDDRSSK